MKGVSLIPRLQFSVGVEEINGIWFGIPLFYFISGLPNGIGNKFAYTFVTVQRYQPLSQPMLQAKAERLIATSTVTRRVN